MGTDSALSRFYYEAGDAERQRTLVGTLALWRAGLALLIAGLLWAFAPFLSRVILASPDYAKYVRITAWSLPFTVFVYFENDVLRTTFQPWKFFALNVVNTLAVAGVSILFVVVLKRDVSGVLYGRLAGDGLSALVGLVLIRHAFALRFDRPLLSRLLAFSLPLIPAAVAYWAISYADRWVLVHYTNLTLVGVYALAVKLSMVMVLGTSAFQLAWGPFAFEHARDPESGHTFSRVLTLYTAVASSLALAIGLFAPEFLAILAPASYHGAAAPGGLLVFGVVALGGYSLAGMGANLAFRTELTAWCSGAAAVITIGLALALVRSYGALGVATATLVGFASSTALLYMASQRVHPLPYRGLRALFLFALAVLTWAGATWAAEALAATGRFPLRPGAPHPRAHRVRARRPGAGAPHSTAARGERRDRFARGRGSLTCAGSAASCGSTRARPRCAHASCSPSARACRGAAPTTRATCSSRQGRRAPPLWRPDHERRDVRRRARLLAVARPRPTRPSAATSGSRSGGSPSSTCRPPATSPCAIPTARYWIVFNGEIYNYLELRAELAALGHAFRTGADTEVLLAAYAQWGADMLPRLNGMWGLAL